jgi:hypothetical protein
MEDIRQRLEPPRHLAANNTPKPGRDNATGGAPHDISILRESPPVTTGHKEAPGMSEDCYGSSASHMNITQLHPLFFQVDPSTFNASSNKDRTDGSHQQEGTTESKGAMAMSSHIQDSKDLITRLGWE